MALRRWVGWIFGGLGWLMAVLATDAGLRLVFRIWLGASTGRTVEALGLLVVFGGLAASLFGLARLALGRWPWRRALGRPRPHDDPTEEGRHDGEPRVAGPREAVADDEDAEAHEDRDHSVT